MPSLKKTPTASPRAVASTSDTASLLAPSDLPAWFEQFLETYISGAAHCFILSGDIDGVTVQGIPQRRFLASIFAEKRAVVAHYSLAQGITFLQPSMETAALELIKAGAAKPAPAPLSSTAKILADAGIGVKPQAADQTPFQAARSPLDALTFLGKLLRAEEGQGRLPCCSIC